MENEITQKNFLDDLEKILKDYNNGKYGIFIDNFIVNKKHDNFSSELSIAIRAWLEIFKDYGNKPINNVKDLLFDQLLIRNIIIEEDCINRIAAIITPDRVSTRNKIR